MKILRFQYRYLTAVRQVIGISIILITLCLPEISFGATFTVTNTNDTGAGSLRQAIDDANVFGPDVIEFNIPNTDLGYDAVNGVWVISPATAYEYFLTGQTTIDGTTQTANQGDTNPFGPEIVIDGTNTITQCFLLVSPANIVKGVTIGNFTYGVQVYGSSGTQNQITECYLGISYDGATAFSNDIAVTISDDAFNNTVTNNIISGNLSAGIGISLSNDNTITGNKIGTDISGTISVPNASGIMLDASTGNVIGGNLYSERNLISGNTDNGILISGTTSSNNDIKGNFIGTDITGMLKLSNSFGIIIVNSGNNTIGGNTANERNIISGNIESAILINGTGAEYNTVIGNYIGVDSTGLNILDNHVGVLIKTNADNNTIGGITPGERNIISGNSEIGVYVESSDSNIVIGNYIGPDATGTGMLAIGDTLFQANGIELNTVAKYNIIGGSTPEERNIISGNRVYGMIFYGQTSENSLIGNYIGTDVTGNVAMPNATGICVDASSNHNYIYNNVLSGNISYGIFLVTNGTDYNEVKGNKIGTNAAGTDTIPNDIGLLLGGGAEHNIIGGTSALDRNIISGNRYNGIEAADNLTNYNEIIGNYIGTDITGSYAVPNGNGIGFSTFPKHNIVDGNLISGNFEIGLILYEFADSNQVINNFIGTAANGTDELANGLSGIVIATGASNNIIGGVGEGNIIAFNENGGVVVIDTNTVNNTISANSIFENNVLGGIDIFPYGVNVNDAGDVDEGANNLMNKPEITSSVYNSSTGNTHISGIIDTQNPENSIIEIFVAEPDASGYGQGKIYIGFAIPDNSGNWSGVYAGISGGEEITTTATNETGSTSEFSFNVSTLVNINALQIETNNISIYPNPSNGLFTVEGDKIQNIEIVDVTGKTIKAVIARSGATKQSVYLSHQPKGMYFIKLTKEKTVITEKIIISK